MKKVIFFLLICVCFFSVKAQYPISQNIGAPTTLVVAKGGLKADSTFIVPTFTDTSKANLSNYIKVYPGALIRVQDTIFMRNKTATKWLPAITTAAGTVYLINSGYGLSGGPITNTGTLTVDTSVSGLSGKYVRISDTSAMLSNYATESLANSKIDSLKRSSDSIYAYKNGQWVFQFKDSTGGGSVPTLQQVLNSGNSAIESLGAFQLSLSDNGGYSTSLSSQGLQSSYNFTNSLYYSDNFSINGSNNQTLAGGLYDLGCYLDASNIYGNSISLKAETTSTVDPFLQWYNGIYYQSLRPQYANGTTDIYMPYVNAVDTLATLSDVRSNKIDTTNKFVNQIYRTVGVDSIYYKIGSNTYAIKDSVGNAGGGGGGGKIYYFNGSVNMGTFGGITMYELGDTARTGSAANFTRSTTGNIANFITDVNKPGLLQIPAGVWTIDAYLSETGGGSNHAQIYAILEKWDGSTITQIATSPVEEITNGSTIDLYTYSISVPTTTLSLTDRIVIQFYIQNTNGKTVTLYTQNGYVGEVHTTFTTGIGALNGLTAPSQTFATGTSGSDFNISSASSTHTFNLPTASATNRGALSSANWSTFNSKISPSDTATMLTPYLRKVDTTGKFVNTITRTAGKDSIIFYIGGTRYAIKDSTGGGGGSAAGSTGYVQFNNAGAFAADSSLFWDNTNKRLGIGTTTPTVPLQVLGQVSIAPTTTSTAAGALSLLGLTPTIAPTSTSSTQFRSLSLSNTFNAPTIAFNSAAGIHGAWVENRILNSGAFTADLIGASINGITLGSNAVTMGSVSNLYGIVNKAFNSFSNTVAATVTNAYGYKYDDVSKASLTITSQAGLNIPSLTSATNNTSILLGTTTIPSGNWSIYNADANKNYFNGNTLIGTTTDAGYKLDVNGTARVVTSLQTPIVRGNTTSGGSLTLSSTSNATKGNIFFGSNAFVDEVNNTLKIGNVLPPTDNAAFKIQVTQEASNATYVATCFSNTLAEGPNFNFAKYKGTAASPLAVASDDRLGQFTFLGYDGSARQASAAFLSTVDGAVSSGVLPARLEFQTGTSGAARATQMTIKSNGNIQFPATNTAAGTTGNQTINKTSGTVNIAAAGTSITVTNSLVTTSSIVFATIRTNDATAVIKNVVPASGSFTINLNAATTAETSIGFFVIN